jgi:acyl carrier protein
MISNFSIHSELRKILSDISKRSCDTLNTDEDLFAIGVLDSFGIIEFVVTLEKHFNCSIPQEDLIPQNLWSIEAISNTLTKLGVSSKS